jgi:hypothetical protein
MEMKIGVESGRAIHRAANIAERAFLERRLTSVRGSTE